MSAELERDVAQFWDLLFDIVTDLEKRLFDHLAQHDLTPPQFYVLKTLMQHEGHCRIGQIAEIHHLTNATMTGLVKRLEAMSPPLVKRSRNTTDGRAVDVQLTEAGAERYHAVQESIIVQVRVVFGMIPTDERQQAIEKVALYFEMLRQLFPISADETSV